ncbi:MULTISPECIES: pleiotropic regulatory protein RsmS [unclassified Pseudoalteromonas]|uniref:pleiotropic regulatory protein RsmS n=1 Tax=unclassified Pseudoalteromonas TaxID=194690 RepID=UPI000CF6C7D0|nr:MULTISPECIES: pleiotropic regulatory protein RsmS [unclassified Pseudoalteromonas]MBS3798625.1 pleiotropic regulatory protein RsmS [Pseudoalteromonas sp. BDTF-M6]
MENSDKSLDDAPDEVKLAVDLIMLLEQHNIDPQLALSALAIVKRDLEQRISEQA